MNPPPICKLSLSTFLSHSSPNGNASSTSPEGGFLDNNLFSVFHIPQDGLNHTNSSEPSMVPFEPFMESSGHLASGTIAGIILGGAVGVISALVLLLYIIRRHRHRMPKNSPSELPRTSTQELPGLLALSGELAAVEILELPGQSSGGSPASTIKSSRTG